MKNRNFRDTRRPMLTALSILGLLCAALLARAPLAPDAFAAGPQILLLKPQLAEMRPDERRALKLLIQNDGGEPDRLLSVSSPDFAQAVLADPQGALLEGLSIPAGEARTLAPEGDALVMLGAPPRDWVEGATAMLDFTFERAGVIRLPLRAGPRPSAGLQLTRSERTVDPEAAAKKGGENAGRGEKLEGPKQDPKF